MTTLYVRHVRAAGLCVTGLRAWCRENQVDMRALCGTGVSLDAHPELRDDPFVQRVLQAAAQEHCDA